MRRREGKRKEERRSKFEAGCVRKRKKKGYI